MTGPLAHNAPFVVTTIGMLLGNHIVLMPRFDAEQTLRLVEKHRVTFLLLVPTMMSRMLRLPDGPPRRRRVRPGGRVPPGRALPAVAQAGVDRLARPETVVELYGGTEGQAVTVITGTEWLAHRGSVGRPVRRDRDPRPRRKPLPAGEVGEIWMRRPGEPPTYRYMGASRARRPRRLGVARRHRLGSTPTATCTSADRPPDMILVGGANVYPAEIEAALDEHPAVQSCCVIGLPDEDLGSIPYAIVELSEPVSDADLLAHPRQRLAPYKLPRVIERATTPLRDDAGKVRRSALRAERITRQATVRT